MGKQPRSRPVPPLVLDAVLAAYKATGGAPGRWTSLGSLNLGAPQDKIDAAILLAALSGWLQVGGKPAHSVIVTADGIELLRKRGLI